MIKQFGCGERVIRVHFNPKFAGGKATQLIFQGQVYNGAGLVVYKL